MKLDYSYNELSQLLVNKSSEINSAVVSVAFDSRRIQSGEGVLFFALTIGHRDGHDFIKDAYAKGVRMFVVSNDKQSSLFQDAQMLVVPDTFKALTLLSTFHRDRFSCPVIAITGSNGKTTVKEWLSLLLATKYVIAKSPKSYNSKLGVAISLLELNKSTEVGIIEVGITGKDDMQAIANMVKPTHGILTSFGNSHRELFDDSKQHLQGKLKLFGALKQFFFSSSIENDLPSNGLSVEFKEFKEFDSFFPLTDKTSKQNIAVAIAMAIELECDKNAIKEVLPRINPLALRMETFNGINDNLVISDTYNLDVDSLRHSLAYQIANSFNKDRIVIIGLKSKNEILELELKRIIQEFAPSKSIFHYSDEPFEESFSNCSILIKGEKGAKMERLSRQFKLQNHQTFLEIDLKSIRHNISFYRSKLNKSTKLLCMVKASSYGSDARTMGVFLEQIGVDYLGVAYPDEGIELRNKGVTLPILVMNCEERSFSQCIENNLEPALFSLDLLDKFIRELIHRSIFNYPIHIKVETGMNRLGFEENEIGELLNLLQSQPEVHVKSIYSHLAESNIPESEFTKSQIDKFERITEIFESALPYPISRHILNSDGILNYPNAQFDMVRLGIGMYGVVDNENLRQAISWFSSVSQIKKINSGSSIGYGRAFVADKNITIGIIPVGYADGFKRSLGNGNGGVVINGSYCKTLGAVCMDMIMVDITSLKVVEGDRVEIIGEHLSVSEFSEKSDTIPYETLTSFSARMHRIYVDQ